MTARLLGEAVNHGKTQAAALADILGGVERLEDVAQHLRRHAGPGIGHRQQDVVPGRDVVARGRIGFVEGGVAGLDDQGATVGHGVARVEGQVQQCVLDQTRIGRGGPEILAGGDLDGDRLAQGAAQQLRHAVGQGADVDRLGLKRLLP